MEANLVEFYTNILTGRLSKNKTFLDDIISLSSNETLSEKNSSSKSDSSGIDLDYFELATHLESESDKIWTPRSELEQFFPDLEGESKFRAVSMMNQSNEVLLQNYDLLKQNIKSQQRFISGRQQAKENELIRREYLTAKLMNLLGDPQFCKENEKDIPKHLEELKKYL